MEFEGRIIRVLPVRSGTSQNGNEWKRLPFVFAYYENGDQRWEDKVLLETWDTNHMAMIAKYCETGQDGKVVIENGSVKLKTLDIKCLCGFGHSVKDVTKKDGTGTVTMNDIKMYKLEVHSPAAQPAQGPQQQMPFPAAAESAGENDDLPF